jgi:UPF0755 protein
MRERLGRWVSAAGPALKNAASRAKPWLADLAHGLARSGRAVARFLASLWRRAALPKPSPSGPPAAPRALMGRLLLRLGAVIAVCGLGWILTLGPVGFGDAQAVPFQISPGQSTIQIGQQLASLGLVRNATIFRFWVQLTGSAGSLRAGEYDLAPNMSIPTITGKLLRGEVKLYGVTVPEGYSVAQIKALLVARGFADAERFDAATAAAAANGSLPVEFASSRAWQILHPLEGFLFPDTYMLYRGITEGEIVRAMVTRFKASITPAMQTRAAELGMTMNEVLTLASIIEKEARLAEERPIISGVFHNRLEGDMALQSCPTVRYVMKDPNGPITSRELAIDSVYNTYMYPGLPPGPICSPGLPSVNAALYPADVEYLYFVAKLDGSHAFARTLSEHNENVRKYLGY